MATCPVCTDYLCSNKGLFMPFVNEYAWSTGTRAILYLFGLIWSFLGLLTFGDTLIQGVEAITSQTKLIKFPKENSETGYSVGVVPFWNTTIVNYALIAIGSPDVLLSTIEVLSNDFKFDELGPTALIGSAAFKLMCITGVCILSVEKGQKEKIIKFKVFIVSSVFSLVAYLWLLIILVGTTPDYIDVWEATVTLLLLPLLVVIAYMVDKDFVRNNIIQDSCMAEETSAESEEPTSKPFRNWREYFFKTYLKELEKDNGVEKEQNLSKNQKADRRTIQKVLKRLQCNKMVTTQDIALFTAKLIEDCEEHSRGWYRINAIRSLTGGSKLTIQMDGRTEELMKTLTTGVHIRAGGENAIIEFSAPSNSILDFNKRGRIWIIRHGNINSKVNYRVKTVDGNVFAEENFKKFDESLVFEKGEVLNYIEIDLMDNDYWVEDKVFFARISIDSTEPGDVGKRSMTEIKVLIGDSINSIRFPKPVFEVKESVGTAFIPVEREGGCNSRVTVKYDTKDLVAVKGRDYYTDKKQQIVFEKGEASKMIEIVINDDMGLDERDDTFEVRLTGVEGNCELENLKTRCVVTIVNDDDFTTFVAKITDHTKDVLAIDRMSYTTWNKQLQNAMIVNGGDIENATFCDYILHFLTFGWKIIAAFIPPPHILGGRLCFLFAVIAIGILTAIIGDLANILGCLIGLKPGLTAITLIPVGTSISDLFASRTAARIEPRLAADKAVGYLAGYNAVNVLLGLGFSWTIAAIYWASQGKTFEVQTGNLIFSIAMYCLCAFVTFLILIVRRYFDFYGKAELGGPKHPKIASGIFLISLWVVFVIISALQTYELIPGF